MYFCKAVNEGNIWLNRRKTRKSSQVLFTFQVRARWINVTINQT